MRLAHRATTTDGAGDPTRRTWRVATAVRVFTLAVAAGSVLGGGHSDSLPVLIALFLIAGVAGLLEYIVRTSLVPWVPLFDVVLAATVISMAAPEADVLIYLAVPPVVAGLYGGLIPSINTAVAAGVAVAATLSVSANGTPDLGRMAETSSWLLAGLGFGLVASWQTRSIRDLVARQAPYAGAHHLMTQLHSLAVSGDLGLNSTLLASELDTALRHVTGARSSAVVSTAEGRRPILLASHGEGTTLVEQVDPQAAEHDDGKALVTLRGTHGVVGHVVLGDLPQPYSKVAQEAEAVADEFALRLGTALLFEDVRHIAAAEERNRIAREMHDGVAQEVVALGYVVDEIESLSSEPEVRSLASGLRQEISRVVTELRHSIFDLRQHVPDTRLSVALGECAREVSASTDLRVHLVLDEPDQALPARSTTELLRIAQEAIANVRRHAHATNLWITLVSDAEGHLRLAIEDDGVGEALPRERHWGLQTMAERAASIGAELNIHPRPGGGTAVHVTATPSPDPTGRNHVNEHHRVADR